MKIDEYIRYLQRRQTRTLKIAREAMLPGIAGFARGQANILETIERDLHYFLATGEFPLRREMEEER